MGCHGLLWATVRIEIVLTVPLKLHLPFALLTYMLAVELKKN